MKINRKELFTALTLAKAGLSKKDIIAQAQHFIFTGTDICTYNDQICIIVPFKTDFSCSVKGEELDKIISGISEENILIDLKDQKLNITTKKTKASLSTMVDEEGKVEEMIENIKIKTNKKNFWKSLPSNFIEGISLCIFSASKDMTQGIRSCIAINDDSIWSTDNLRISWYKMNDNVEEMLIPVRNAEELVKYQDVIEYGLSKGWVHLKTKEGLIFSSRTIEGDFTYSVLMNFFKEPDKTFDLPKELKDVLQNISVLADGTYAINKSVNIEIDDGVMTCKAMQDTSWVTKVLDIDYNEEPLHFSVNPFFFAQILNKTTTFGIYENAKVAIFIRDNFKHIMALPA